jgi:hypothetical protein
MATLAVAASNEWLKRPMLTLIWKDATSFQKDAEDFDGVFGQRLSTGSGKTAKVKVLINLDKKADDHLKFVKGYILEKWEADDKANYPRFGIEAGNKSYRLPHDRDKRNDALKLMVQAIQDDGFQTRQYGLVFWETLSKDYSKALQEANDTDGAISGFVGDKKVLKETVVDVLEALVHLVKANYRNTYPQVLRQFGYQKENY